MSSFSNSVGNSEANQAQVNAEQNSGSDLVFSVKIWSAQHIAMCAVFTALGIVLSYIEFPVFPAAAWLKYSPVGAVCILAGLAFGPITAALVSVLAWSTHLFTNLPGAIMAIVCCLALSVPAGLICRKNKSAKNIAIALIISSVAELIAAAAGNLIVTPMCFHMPTAKVAALLLPAILPFNLIKVLIDCTIVFLVYKPIMKAVKSAVKSRR
ncbi:MAG: ECF transporter S component [Bifidobacteriaceae bacterium]|nr:ECF transporter S component [Bifidobacteriaceae bacterium]